LEDYLCKSLVADAINIAADHLLRDPEDVKCTILYMKYLTKFLHALAKLFTDEHSQKRMILSLMLVLLCSLIFLVKSSVWQSNDAAIMEDTAVLTIPTTSTITPTKWWIKMTATVFPSTSTAPTVSDEPLDSNCSNWASSPLRIDMYAHVALNPPLPNRIRASASLSSKYIGQIEPGAGLKVIDGPVCADGYSWLLVESFDKGIRGWTVEGRNSEQWLIPCPNVNVKCSFLATPTPLKVIPPDDTPANPTENTCKSNKLAVGLFAHVNQDSLLIVRAEPFVGSVIGHTGPMSIVNVIEGPACVGGTIWWKVNALDLGLMGWTTENYLAPCPRDNQCDQ
jgi:hypothetical protein